MERTTNCTHPDRIVTIAVDVQNDFLPGGSLAVTNGNEVTTPLNRIMDLTRDFDGTVVATRDWHPANTPHFDKWPVHCVADTKGTAFDNALRIDANTIILDKGTGQTDGYSGFDGRGPNGETIEQIVTPRTTRERVAVLIGGLATDYCVRATVLDAAELARKIAATRQGIVDVYALTDAMRGVDLQPGDSQKALAEMQAAGAELVTTDFIITGGLL